MVEIPELVLRELRAAVGERNVLTTPELTEGFAADWTGRFVGATPAVVRPHSTDEVARVLALLSTEGISVIPQGGNTGLVGGGVPLRGEVVLSLAGLSRLEEADLDAGQVTAEAGVTIGQLRQANLKHGLTFAVDIASRDSATVGGAIATNAGGLRVLRYGDMAAQLVGVEAVFSDGSVVSHLGGLTKDNTGYRLHQLLAGSEGTLAVVTRARLRLIPHYPQRAAVLVALPDLAAAVALAGRLRRFVPPVEAVEVFLQEGLDLVTRYTDAPPPFRVPSPVYLLAEAADRVDPTDVLVEALADIEPDNVLLADTEADRQRLWRYRERHTEAINRAGVPRKHDVSVPLTNYVDFAEAVPKVVKEACPSALPIRWGHIADGNLHISVLQVPDEVDVDGPILELVAQFGGSISAEHGIGAVKRPWLHLNRSAAEISLARQIKSAVDPRNVLHPHNLFPVIRE